MAGARAPFAVVYGATYDFDTIHLDLNQSDYLGFHLGNTEFSPETVEFGWAELGYDGAAVSVRNSATERTGLGLYAGTGQAIPEPATAGLRLLGGGAAAVVARRHRG